MKKKIILVVIAVIAVFAVFCFTMTAPVDKNNKETVVITVENGSGTAQIADVLSDKDMIKNEIVFRFFSKIRGYDGKYMAGSYAVSQSMSMNEIMKMIASGETAGSTFTVIEGQTVEKIAKNLDKEGIVSYDEFMKEAQTGSFNWPFLEGNEKSMFILEGFLYPDTYHFDINSDAHTVIDTMLRRFNEVVYDKVKNTTDYSFRDIIIIASIIQREAGRTEDMKDVSSVIYNRLKIDMHLQMDSIVSYILQEDKVDLSYGDIGVESDYNPYKNKGLPPGPISNPGIDAVEAAINPNNTDYLYFVLSDKLDGTTSFSKDYDQFEKDKKAYYDAREKAGKK